MLAPGRICRRKAEPTDPHLVTFEGFCYKLTGSALHSLVPFTEGTGHVWVRDSHRSWDQPDDEVLCRRAPRTCGLYPTLDTAVQDGGGVFGVLERPNCDELGEGPLHVESTRLRVPESCEQWAVGRAPTNLLEAVRSESRASEQFVPALLLSGARQRLVLSE
jgi:hypothetical protein